MSFGETGYIIHTFCREIYNNLLDSFASTSWNSFLSLLSIWLTCSGLWTFEGVCSVGGCTVTKHLILELFPRIYIVLASLEDKTLKVDFINKQWKKEKEGKADVLEEILLTWLVSSKHTFDYTVYEDVFYIFNWKMTSLTLTLKI